MARTTLAALLLCFALAAQKQESRNKPDSFAGVFQNEKMKIELRQLRGNRYEGMVFFNGRTYPVTGRSERGTLTGAFTDERTTFPFTAAFEGERLRFVTGGAGYVLERETPVNPLAAPPPSAARQAPADPARTHRHTTGVAFTVPDGWTVRDTPASAALLPPSENTPEELYIIATHEGFAGPEDPTLIEQLRRDLAGTGFRFDRAGEKDAYSAGGRGITVLTWELRNPETGVPMMIRIFLNESAGRVQSLAAIAARERVLGWDAQLRHVAASMIYEPPAGKPPGEDIVESWTRRLAGVTVTQTAASGGFASTKVLHLGEDGSFVYSGSASFPASTGAPESRTTASGRWSVIVRNGQVLLELTLAGGTQNLLPLSIEDGQVLLDGARAHLAARTTPPRTGR
jgi:hypothetical protein